MQKKLSLRAMEPTDVELLYNWENDVANWHVSSTIIPYSRYVLRKFVDSGIDDFLSSGQLRLMIENEEKETIGCIDLFEYDATNKRVNAGVLIDKKYRTQGYSVMAFDKIKNYCFITLNLHQIFCTVQSSNPISNKMMISAGYTQCGVRKDWYLKDGKYEDEIMYQLINNDR